MNSIRKFSPLILRMFLMSVCTASLTAFAQVENADREAREAGIQERDKAHFAETEKSAKEGDASSQYDLSQLYLHGTGVEKNNREAIYWLRKAAEMGNPQAQFHWGMALVARKNYSEAMTWLLDDGLAKVWPPFVE